METGNKNFEILMESLQLLAADAVVQCEVLPKYVHVPDEVALVFGDSVLFLDDIVDGGQISTEQKSRIEELDAILDQMSSNKELWTIEALEQDPEWHRVRKLAGSILASLGMERRKPMLFWLQYVEPDNDIKVDA